MELKNSEGRNIDTVVREYVKADERSVIEDVRAAVTSGRRAVAVHEVLAGTFLDEGASDALFRALFLGEGNLDESARVLVERIRAPKA